MKIAIDAPPEMLESMLNGILISIPKDPLPPLYRSGIRYTSDPGEHWQLPAETAVRGSGDCEDLALYRAHELRRDLGEDARVHVYRSAPKTLHAVVRRANGTLEDPSRALGMSSGGRMGEGFTVPPPAPQGAMLPGFPGMMPGGGMMPPLDPITAAALMFIQSPAGKKLVQASKRKLKKLFW